MTSDSPEDVHIASLHRYYIWANRMRTHFDEHLSALGPDIDPLGDVEGNLYMSYWYGGLYVVVEGWQTLKLSDSTIDSLLEDPNVALLRRYRNGTFHYQEKYWDDRFLQFIVEGANSAGWVRELNRQFGRFFLEWHKERRRRAETASPHQVEDCRDDHDAPQGSPGTK